VDADFMSIWEKPCVSFQPDPFSNIIICFVLGWLTCVAHEQLYEQFENLGSTAEDDFIDVRHLALKARAVSWSGGH
jgi:hypothetical protein